MSRTAACVTVLAVLIGCRRPPLPPPPAAGPVEYEGLHNVLRLSDKLLSGSSPDGAAGFRSLQQLGVKTVISVDGAGPDIETARSFRLRYVHLPIGYDGVPRAQALRIAKAVRDLPGLVYLHCHHGKHRGPAAASVAAMCLDERCTAADAVAMMQRAGTDPHYVGLYAAPGEVARPTAAELDAVPADFPEVAEVPGLAQAMVRIDERWERLKLAKAAGWKVPPDYPDIDPPHEALQLVEQYREAARLPEVRDRPAEFREWLAEAERSASALEAAFRPGSAEDADGAFRAANAVCAKCHAKYRDVPRR